MTHQYTAMDAAWHSPFAIRRAPAPGPGRLVTSGGTAAGASELPDVLQYFATHGPHAKTQLVYLSAGPRCATGMGDMVLGREGGRGPAGGGPALVPGVPATPSLMNAHALSAAGLAGRARLLGSPNPHDAPVWAWC